MGVWKDNSGQVTFLALLLCMMLLSYAIFIILKCQKTSLEIQTRLQSYQCFHYLDVETSNYIRSMGYFNKALWLNHKLMLVPATAAEAKMAQEALIGLQQLLHFSYVKNLSSNRFCDLTQSSSYVTKIPYRTRLVLWLERDIDGTVPLAHKDWTVWILSASKQKTYFALQGDYKIKNLFSTQTSLEAKEVKAF